MSSTIVSSIQSAIKHWYIPLIIGILNIAIGVASFVYPSDTYVALSFTFSLSFIFIGVLLAYFAFANRDQMQNWGWVMALGIVVLLIGILLLSNPDVSMGTLPFYTGFMVMFLSLGAIGFAADLKSYGIKQWKTMMALGVLGLIFSFILLWNPEFAGMTLVVWTGLAFLTIGVFYIYLSYKLNNVHKVGQKVDQFINPDRQ